MFQRRSSPNLVGGSLSLAACVRHCWVGGTVAPGVARTIGAGMARRYSSQSGEPGLVWAPMDQRPGPLPWCEGRGARLHTSASWFQKQYSATASPLRAWPPGSRHEAGMCWLRHMPASPLPKKCDDGLRRQSGRVPFGEYVRCRVAGGSAKGPTFPIMICDLSPNIHQQPPDTPHHHPLPLFLPAQRWDAASTQQPSDQLRRKTQKPCCPTC